MKLSQLIFQVTHILFHRFYYLYKVMYFVFKNKQDKQEIDLIKNLVKKKDNIIDVGANIGFYTTLFSELTGESGKVYAFEPDTYNYKRLLQTTKGKNNIITENAAVSSTTGQLEFYTSQDKNFDHRAYAPDKFAGSYKVNCISLDEYLGSTTIALLKVDVQGYEMQVYQGAQSLLKANPGIRILSEFWPYGLMKAGSGKEEFFRFFDQQGFSIYLLNNGTQTLIKESDLAGFPVAEEIYFNVYICKA